MQKLRHLAIPRASATVTIRGETYTVTEVRVRDRAILARLFPSPSAPLRPNPARGSRSPEEPDYNDPKYLAAFSACLSDRAAATIAVALAVDDHLDRQWDHLTTDDERREWCKDAIETVGQLGVGEFARVQKVLDGFAEAATGWGTGPNA